MTAVLSVPEPTLEPPECGGRDPGDGDSDPGCGSIRRPTRPRAPGPRNTGNRLTRKQLGEDRPDGKMNHVADYGYRYYDPLTGRWPSRDPIGDKSFYDAYISGASLQEQADAMRDRLKPPYLMIRNDAINASDRLGLDRYITRFDPFLLSKMHVNVAVDTWADKNGKWVKSGTVTFSFSASPFAAGYGFEDFYTGGDLSDPRNYQWILLNPINIPLSSFSGTGLISQINELKIADPITRKSTPCEDRVMFGKILLEKLNPPRYSALSFNCVHWAVRAFTSYWLTGLWQGRCCNPDRTVWEP
jgi:hypothetical protein